MTTNYINTESIVNALEYCKKSGSDCCKCEYFMAPDCTILEDAAKAIKALKKVIESSGGNHLVLRNCVNCDHAKVCMTVHTRRVTKSNVYTPCEHWKQIDE